MLRLDDKTMLFLAATLCLTVFSAGALLGIMTAHTAPKPPCRPVGSGEVVVNAENCDALAQRAFMRLLFAQPQ
jgi:hypothetical protein